MVLASVLAFALLSVPLHSHVGHLPVTRLICRTMADKQIRDQPPAAGAFSTIALLWRLAGFGCNQLPLSPQRKQSLKCHLLLVVVGGRGVGQHSV